MSTLFGFLFFVSVVGLVIGLVRPKIFGRFIKNATRKSVSLIFGAIALVCIIGGIATDRPAVPTNSNEVVANQEETALQNISNTNTESDSTQTSQPSSSQDGLIKIASVVDGDTIKVILNNKTETVRLIGIDTPETVDPRKPVQCFGKEASNKAKAVLTGKKVTLEADSTQGDRDKYSRLLRYVFLEDGTNFNKYMIAEGYAHEYTYSLPYKYQTEFKAAEKQAREQNKGLWSPDTCNGDTTKSATVIPPVDNSTPPDNSGDNKPQVKKSSSGICHEKGISQYYDRTTNYTPYNSIAECLASGGRLPN
jgi:micrococcal nuclease